MWLWVTYLIAAAVGALFAVKRWNGYLMVLVLFLIGVTSSLIHNGGF